MTARVEAIVNGFISMFDYHTLGKKIKIKNKKRNSFEFTCKIFNCVYVWIKMSVFKREVWKVWLSNKAMSTVQSILHSGKDTNYSDTCTMTSKSLIFFSNKNTPWNFQNSLIKHVMKTPNRDKI